ncbi:SRPBCC domain-containing protein [Porphyromonadaceae bacterium OttesenSCG-928-L07]|nr:SRPBCC domain-containing protein [Porphyromonadaceae bacterium OttesenSCG-928-L07]MDL2252342.1 SRPBCC domain-containing protein [Odoribacter sp. OttesenSCG-928-J03]MDL2283488.1 SRPBCC domain-containing protein [Odoribacter sp. OttesenSCG-928-G04]
MHKKIRLEYSFSSSVKILYSRLSTASGLSEWFADDVYQNENRFVFVWQGSESCALLKEHKHNSFVRFHWEDADDEYFEFRVEEDPLTKDVALIITDVVEEDEEEEAKELWDKQIESLHRALGA